MENKNSSVALESENQGKRLIGIFAIGGGALFIIVVILFFVSIKGSKAQDDDERFQNNIKLSDKDILSANANNNDFGANGFGNDDFTELNSTGRGLLSDLGLDSESLKSSNDDLLNSVKDDKVFQSNAFFNEFATQESKQEQPWWLTKDGYPKPRIIKGASDGVITQKIESANSGSASGAGTAQNQKLDPQDLENKTLLALNGLLEKAENIDYDALAAANNEMGGAPVGTNSDVAYRQQSEFKGEVYMPTSARFSQFNQTLLLPKSTYIPCSLQTRIVSELKGSIGCIVASDIYSSNGQTLLIEKGSQIFGTYTNADVTDGSTRLYVVWQEIRTPNNIIIPVDSGGVDPLGGAGIAGDRDNHYLERFGAAILLSVIDGTIKSLGTYVNSRVAPNTAIYSPSDASQIANTALRQTINIKPTIYRNQGDLVGVYVNKDIDFSRVYELRLRSRK